jgi:hypothetical protein
MLTALCAEMEPKFLLRAARSAALNKNFVPHTLAKRCKEISVEEVTRAVE